MVRDINLIPGSANPTHVRVLQRGFTAAQHAAGFEDARVRHRGALAGLQLAPVTGYRIGEPSSMPILPRAPLLPALPRLLRVRRSRSHVSFSFSSINSIFSSAAAAAAAVRTGARSRSVVMHARNVEAQLVVLLVRADHREEHRQDDGHSQEYSNVSGCDFWQFAITKLHAAAKDHQTAAGAEGRHLPRMRMDWC